MVELAVDLAVEKVAEGQKIKGKPLAFEGRSASIPSPSSIDEALTSICF